MVIVEFHRVNPVTRCCDDSGRTSCFVINHKVNEVKSYAKNCLRNNIHGWLDFDSDVYMIKVINNKSGKVHICV